MANSLLTTSAFGGSQTSTQNPQQVPVSSSFSAAQQGSSVQPGTPTAALTSSGGLPLKGGALPSINLASVTASQVQSAPAKHHTNPALFGISAVLFVFAVVLFYSASRPVKNTTDT